MVTFNSCCFRSSFLIASFAFFSCLPAAYCGGSHPQSHTQYSEDFETGSNASTDSDDFVMIQNQREEKASGEGSNRFIENYDSLSNPSSPASASVSSGNEPLQMDLFELINFCEMNGNSEVANEIHSLSPQIIGDNLNEDFIATSSNHQLEEKKNGTLFLVTAPVASVDHLKNKGSQGFQSVMAIFAECNKILEDISIIHENCHEIILEMNRIYDSHRETNSNRL